MKYLLNNISLLLIVMLVGCESNFDDRVSEVEYAKEIIHEELDNEKDTEELDKRFQSRFPDANVYNKIWSDVTNDGVDDLIIVFDTNDLKTNFAVLTEGMFNAVSFNDMNSDIVFSKGSESIKLLENPNRLFFFHA
jgi:PBP1b-binding outer membrane lipoprotein LpoB